MRLNKAAIADLIARGAAPGCAVVIDGGTQKLEYATGAFHPGDPRPVTTHTLYDVASVTKLFTTALVVRLHDAGRIDLDAPMGEYMEEFRKSGLTVTDLLTHHASFQVYLSRMARETPGLTEMARRIAIPEKADPHYNYQSSTFLFLGLLVERLNGRPFTDCLRGLTGELDLQETLPGCDGAGLDAPPTEIRDGRPWVNRTHDESAYAAGGIAPHAGLFASAGDLARFGRAWLEHKIAGPETTRRVFTNYSRFPGEEQGLGWYNTLTYFPLWPDWLLCHSGFTGPLLAVNPRNGAVYALTCNRTYYGRKNHLYRRLWVYLLERELADAMTLPAFMTRMDLDLTGIRNETPRAYAGVLHAARGSK